MTEKYLNEGNDEIIQSEHTQNIIIFELLGYLSYEIIITEMLQILKKSRLNHLYNISRKNMV